MRIVFAGTQSVGKTTLIEDLLEALPHFRAEEEPIRAVARLTGEPPPSVPTREAERRLIEYGRGRLRDTPRGSCVLFDRSPLDAYAHAVLSMEVGGEVDPGFLAEMHPLVRESLDACDLMVFVPVDGQVGNEHDGFRYLNEVNRRRVDTILEDLLQPVAGLYRGPISVVRGSREHRVQQVVRAFTALGGDDDSPPSA
ncbi:MAG: ATP-binding protein [Phycisphaerales bacterium]|nr:ATP-binding protein [Phycisphaerales bacterium]